MRKHACPWRWIASAALALGLALGGAGDAWAQQGSAAQLADSARAAGEMGGPVGATTIEGFDLEAWNRLATRAEEVITAGRASTAALEDLRIQLTEARDALLALRDSGASRVATLEAQLEALGPAPAEGEPPEAPEVASRRAELAAQLAQVRARAAAVAEAFSRADGLLKELSELIRKRRAGVLFTAGPSPLAPGSIAAGAALVQEIAGSVTAEVAQALSTDARVAAFRARVPVVLLLLVAAVVLAWPARSWAQTLTARIAAASGPAGRGMAAVAAALIDLALPLIALFALLRAAEVADLFSLRGLMLLDGLRDAGLAIIVGHWLGVRLLSDTATWAGLLPADSARRHRARTTVLGMAAGYGLLLVARRIEAAMQPAPEAQAALDFLPLAIACLSLAGFALVLRPRAPAEPAGADAGEQDAFLRRLRQTLAHGLVAIGFIAPVAAAFGYGALARSVVEATVLTVAILSGVAVAHRLLGVIAAIVTGRAAGGVPEEAEADGAGQGDGPIPLPRPAPLLSIGIAVVLILAALPLIAIAWGASVADLAAFWARAKEGVPIGSARLTPAAALAFVVVFAIGYTLTRLAQGALSAYVLPNTRLDVGAQAAIRTGTGYLGIFLSAVIAISAAGLDLSGLAIVAGALSVGIGFGLQAIVSNFVSGLILLVERPIKEGDWVEVGGVSGYVKGVSVRATEIETFDRATVVVPNSELISGVVTNWTHRNQLGRVIVPVGVAYGTDTRRVADLLLEIARAHPMVAKTPAPSVVFQGFGADSLNFEIRVILKDVNWMLSVKSDLNHEIARRFAEEGIEIPFAQRDIHLKDIDRIERALARRGARTQEGEE